MNNYKSNFPPHSLLKKATTRICCIPYLLHFANFVLRFCGCKSNLNITSKSEWIKCSIWVKLTYSKLFICRPWDLDMIFLNIELYLLSRNHLEQYFNLPFTTFKNQPTFKHHNWRLDWRWSEALMITVMHFSRNQLLHLITILHHIHGWIKINTCQRSNGKF